MGFTDALNKAITLANTSVVLYPLIRTLVASSEQTFPGPKRGLEKADAVMAGVEVAAKTSAAVKSAVEGHDPDTLAAIVAQLTARAVAKDINKQVPAPAPAPQVPAKPKNTSKAKL